MANARKNVVGIILLVGLIALAAMLGFRENSPFNSYLKKDKELQEPNAGHSAPLNSDKENVKPPKGTTPENNPADGADDQPLPLDEGVATDRLALDRPLRVVSLGWDLAVPGHLANQGQDGKESALSKEGIDVEIKSVKNLDSIKTALANGGAHKAGADIAILPLPEMVASYEDLRALKPQIFFVAGWSRGRDALFAHKQNSLLKLPRKGKIEVRGERGASSMLLALYLLDISGVGADRIRLSNKADKPAMFAAVDRGATPSPPKDSSLSLSSADASALIPFVAIAPEGFLNHRATVAGFITAWLKGVDELESDVPSAARQVSALKGAPETLTLVRSLGLIDFSGLRDNVRRAGLAGRDPVNLSSLFQLTWQLWRGVDVLTTPAPKNVPMSFDVIASLALQSTGLTRPEDIEANFSAAPMVRGITTTLENAALMAGVFGRSSLRIGAFASKKKSDSAVYDLATRYGLSPKRFESKASLSKKKTIVLEVFPAL